MRRNNRTDQIQYRPDKPAGNWCPVGLQLWILGVLLLFQIVASGQTDLSTVDPEMPPSPVDRDTTGDALLDAQVSATSGKDQEAAEETVAESETERSLIEQADLLSTDEPTEPEIYHESRWRRFEIITLTSLPFTAIHSFVAIRGVKMVLQNRFAPKLSDQDYQVIGICTITSSVLIGLWDWYNTRDGDASEPLIPEIQSPLTRPSTNYPSGWNQDPEPTQIYAFRPASASSADIFAVNLLQIRF